MMRAPEGAHDKRLRHRVATAFSHRRRYPRKAEERAAGWDSRFVSLYRVERERAATRCTVGSEHLVGGLVVTDFERPRQRAPVLGDPGKVYSPHRWGARGRRLVGGLVVTEFERPRPRRPVLEGPGINSKAYSPHRWSRRGN